MKHALVTGADRGLGFGLTQQLLNEGYTVYAGRYMDDWPALDALKRQHQQTLKLVPLDVASDESVNKAAQSIRSWTERLDLLINNAGITGGNEQKLSDPINMETIMNVYNVNTLGPLRVTNALVDLVLNSDDKCIVNISSEAGSIAECERVGWYGYNMSKAALNMQSAIVYNEIKSRGGRLLVFHPGWMQTYMSGQLNTRATYTAEQAAEKILHQVRTFEGDHRDRPPFIDLEGQRWPW